MVSALGPQLAGDINGDSLEDISLLRSTGFDKELAFRCINTAHPQKQSSLKNFGTACQLFAESTDSRVPVISIPDLSAFGAPGGKRELSAILELAKEGNAIVIVNSSTAFLREANDLAKAVLANSTIRFLLAQDESDQAYAKEHLFPATVDSYVFSMLERMRTKIHTGCMLVTPKSKGVMRFIMNPMEHWMWTETTEAEEARTSMWEEVARKNSKLSKTDIARQAIYYLGLKTDC